MSLPGLAAICLSLLWAGGASQADAGNGDARPCPDPVRVEATGWAALAESPSPADLAEADAEAVRDALLTALAQVGGAEIARQSQTVSSAGPEGVGTARQERTVIRNAGRIVSWSRLDAPGSDTERGGTIEVTLDVVVCPSPSAAYPLVVALAELPGVDGLRDKGVRGLLLEVLRDRSAADAQPAFVTTQSPPGYAFHDIAVEIDPVVTVRSVDARAQAEILARLTGGSALPEAALRYQLVEAQVTARAVRFVDRETISETTQAKQRVAPGVDPGPTRDALLRDTSLQALGALSERLAAGALHP